MFYKITIIIKIFFIIILFQIILNKKNKRKLNENNPYENFDKTINNYSIYHKNNLNNTNKELILIYDPWRSGGINNRLVSFATCFAITLIQNRLFFMTQWKQFEKIFDIPIHNFIYGTEYNKFNEIFGYKMDITLFSLYSGKPQLKIKDILECEDKNIAIQTQYSLTRYIVIYAKNRQQLFDLGLLYKESDNATLGYQMGHILFNRLFKLQPKLQNRFLKYAERLKGHYVIGFHFRTGTGEFKDNGKFLTLNQTIEISYQAKEWSKEHENILWFIASDNMKVIKSTLEIAKPLETYTINDLPITHTRKDRNMNGALRAIFEEKLIGMADKMVLTHLSSMSEAIFYFNKISLDGKYFDATWLSPLNP